MIIEITPDAVRMALACLITAFLAGAFGGWGTFRLAYSRLLEVQYQAGIKRGMELVEMNVTLPEGCDYSGSFSIKFPEGTGHDSKLIYVAPKEVE